MNVEREAGQETVSVYLQGAAEGNWQTKVGRAIGFPSWLGLDHYWYQEVGLKGAHGS